jgi:hypothetical protein
MSYSWEINGIRNKADASAALFAKFDDCAAFSDSSMQQTTQ